MSELSVYTDEYYMNQALILAQQAFEEGEVPVGAVIVANKQIIAKGYNQTEKLNDVTAHAEMIALTTAFNSLNSKYIRDCTMYVTLEPCAMCAGALYWSQIGGLKYGAPDEQRGFSTHGTNLLHPKTVVSKGIQQEACATLINTFFKKLRN